MRKVVIFGLKDYAELAHYYLTHDSSEELVAFSVHRDYLPQDGKFRGLPVVAFEDVEAVYPPDEFHFFAPMSPKNMNRDREEVYLMVKRKGYRLISKAPHSTTRSAPIVFLE